jgi:hypothetical protein
MQTLKKGASFFSETWWQNSWQNHGQVPSAGKIECIDLAISLDPWWGGQQFTPPLLTMGRLWLEDSPDQNLLEPGNCYMQSGCFFCDVVCLRNPEDLVRKDMLFCWFHLKFLYMGLRFVRTNFSWLTGWSLCCDAHPKPQLLFSQGKTHAWQVRECGVSHLPGFCILWHNHILHPCKLLCCHRCSSCNLIFQPPTTSTTI